MLYTRLFMKLNVFEMLFYVTFITMKVSISMVLDIIGTCKCLLYSVVHEKLFTLQYYYCICSTFGDFGVNWQI